MENTTRAQQQLEENKNPSSSPINSPRSASSNNNGVVQIQHQSRNNNNNKIHTPPLTPVLPISRSTDNNNPYPTTFVQADTNNFKQVVQLLTGSSETAAKQATPPPPQTDPPNNNNNSKSFVIPPIKTTTPKKQNNFKLYERRANNFKNSLMINTLANNCAFSSTRNIISNNNRPEILSPSLLDFPKLALNSPVTPLNEDPFNRSSSSPYCLGGNSSSSSSSSSSLSSEEEQRAIAEKGFYLHPSPMSTPRDHQPQLLPLFPET